MRGSIERYSPLCHRETKIDSKLWSIKWQILLAPNRPPTRCSRVSTFTASAVLVTGVSARPRVETARSLVAHGATVVGTRRDLDKARQCARRCPVIRLSILSSSTLASLKARATRPMNC